MISIIDACMCMCLPMHTHEGYIFMNSAYQFHTGEHIHTHTHGLIYRSAFKM